jgi:hypothetical protein
LRRTAEGWLLGLGVPAGLDSLTDADTLTDAGQNVGTRYYHRIELELVG